MARQGNRDLHTQLKQMFYLLFSDAGQGPGMSWLTERDQFANVITGDRQTDLWRAWRQASGFLHSGSPYRAADRLNDVHDLHPLQQESTALVDLEISFLTAEALTEANEIAAAYESWEDIHTRFFQFMERFRADADRLQIEMWRMLSILGGQRPDNLDSGGEVILRSWAASRGLKLIMDILFNRVTLTSKAISKPEAAQLAESAQQDLDHFYQLAGIYPFETDMSVDFFLGNLLTEYDPQSALDHFEKALKSGRMDRGQIFTTVYNSANCLVRLHRYREAYERYEDAQLEFEAAGRFREAAQICMAKCIAEWHADGEPSVRGSLEGAIQFFEESLPKEIDTETLFVLKRLVEPGYQLLARLLADLPAPDEADLDELIAILWALLSRDYVSGLESKGAQQNDINTGADGWDALVTRMRKPTAVLKRMLAPYRGTALVHLISLPDRIPPDLALQTPPNANPFGVTWLLFGYDKSGSFRYAACTLDSEQTVKIRSFLDALEEQLTADVLTNVLRTQELQDQLGKLGDEIGGMLSNEFCDALLAMEHLFYMPHPFGDFDEFPIQGLRLKGEWLGASYSITRVTTINQLREMMAANNRPIQANPTAVIVTGSLAGGTANNLVEVENEASRVEQYLHYMGFDSQQVPEANSNDLMNMLSGGAGLIHYIGHGYANVAYEGLPLASGEFVTPNLLTRLPSPRIPFVFICACEAARVRYGAGGYQVGVASKLLEKSAPGVLAFNFPIPENMAYRIAREFYGLAFRMPLGEALRCLRGKLAQELPAYAWLSLVAYGDPDFVLPAMAKAGPVPAIHDRAGSWVSRLCKYTVQRTEETRQLALEAVQHSQDPLQLICADFLKIAFQNPPASSAAKLAKLERRLDPDRAMDSVGMLALRATIFMEKAHLDGIDDRPIRLPTSKDGIRELFHQLLFASASSAVLDEAHLNGMATAMLGRLLTADQGNLRHSQDYLAHMLEVFQEGGIYSPFVERMREETVRLIQQFGGSVR